MKKKLSFIILQYNTPKETLECVESIQKNLKNKKDYSIIIIDNHSSKENLKLFYKLFNGKNNLDILKLDKNNGFSRGNNIGFEYARKKYNPDFYYIINNDTIISQKNTIELIEEEYKKSQFDVMGPDVINPDGKHSSPIKIEISKTIIGMKIKWIMKIIKNSIFIKKHLSSNSKYFDKRQEQVILHGPALIFSKKCFNKLQKPFYPETFLFWEEGILGINSRRYGLKSIYNPRLKILHNESSSINKGKSSLKKKLFHFKHLNKSMNIYYSYKKKNSL